MEVQAGDGGKSVTLTNEEQIVKIPPKDVRSGNPFRKGRSARRAKRTVVETSRKRGMVGNARTSERRPEGQGDNAAALVNHAFVQYDQQIVLKSVCQIAYIVK